MQKKTSSIVLEQALESELTLNDRGLEVVVVVEVGDVVLNNEPLKIK